MESINPFYIKKGDINKYCGCYWCFEIFLYENIKEFIGKNQDALCPYCHLDCVIEINENLTKESLKSLHEKFFDY